MKQSVLLMALFASCLPMGQDVLAAKPPGAGGGGGGNGGGNGGGDDPTYLISVDPHDPPLAVNSPLYDPPEGCLGSNPTVTLWTHMPKHECATLTTSDGYQLTDDIHILAQVDENTGDIVSVRINGQDVIGKAGLHHKSDLIAVIPQTPNLSGDFTLHVDADDIMIWKCNTHVPKPNTVCDVPVGTVSLGDLIFVIQ